VPRDDAATSVEPGALRALGRSGPALAASACRGRRARGAPRRRGVRARIAGYARVPIHARVSEDPARTQDIVPPAVHSNVVDRRRAPVRLRYRVMVQLQLVSRPADLARAEAPLALSARTEPHRALDVRRHRVRARQRRLLPRLLDEPPALRRISRSRSSPASRISPALAPGIAWESASFAASSFARRLRENVHVRSSCAQPLTRFRVLAKRTRMGQEREKRYGRRDPGRPPPAAHSRRDAARESLSLHGRAARAKSELNSVNHVHTWTNGCSPRRPAHYAHSLIVNCAAPRHIALVRSHPEGTLRLVSRTRGNASLVRARSGRQPFRHQPSRSRSPIGAARP
jgi:hypothetical protein